MEKADFSNVYCKLIVLLEIQLILSGHFFNNFLLNMAHSRTPVLGEKAVPGTEAQFAWVMCHDKEGGGTHNPM